MLKRPQSPSELDRGQRRRTIEVILRTLGDAEHSGGCVACDVYHALTAERHRIGFEPSLSLTVQILDAMTDSGRIDRCDGMVLTTWKVKRENGTSQRVEAEA